MGRQGDATVDTNKDKNVVEDTSSAGGSGKLDNDVNAHNNPKMDQVNVSDGNSLFVGESSQKIVVSDPCVKDVSPHTSTCVLGVNLGVDSPALESKPLFLSKNWRDVLCRCEKCVVLYSQKRIAFLLDKEDSIAEYEQMATQKRKEKLQQQEGAELSLFNKLGHIEKMEILSGIADMKDEIRTFLVCFCLSS